MATLSFVKTANALQLVIDAMEDHHLVFTGLTTAQLWECSEVCGRTDSKTNMAKAVAKAIQLGGQVFNIKTSKPAMPRDLDADFESDPESEEPKGSCTCSSCVEAKDDPESNQCENCEAVLHEWVAIKCLVKPSTSEELCWCADCWEDLKGDMKAEGWKNGNDSESEDDQE